MHCSFEEDEHSHRLFEAPNLTTDSELPRCTMCDAPMKPHCLFFDEAYSEHYYKNDTVLKYVESSDCLVIVGTSLSTSLAK